MILSVSCNGRPKKDKGVMDKKFIWTAATTTAPMYPISVYQSILIYDDGFSYLDASIASRGGGWGSPGDENTSDDNKLKRAPYRLVITWLSWVEAKFYKGVFDLPTERIAELLNEGYVDFSKERVNYTHIVVGMAPKGVVVVWVWGIEKCVEVGRYQAEETDEVAVKNIAPSCDRLGVYPSIEEYCIRWKRKSDMLEHVNKHGLSEGLWDKYRERFWFRPVVEYAEGNNGITDHISMHFYNGERDCLNLERLAKNEFMQYARINFIKVLWSSGDKLYRVKIKMDEEEIFKLYQQIYLDKPDEKAELAICVNEQNNYIRVFLRSADKDHSREIILKKADIKINNDISVLKEDFTIYKNK